MPELPEVETVVRGLKKALSGARFIDIEQHRGDLRTALPKNLPARLKGRRIEGIKRRAKYILIALDKGETLILHLGMSGRMVLSHGDKKPPGKHDHLVFHFDNGVTLRFNDPRRFGLCDLAANKNLPKHKLLRALGAEPLEPQLTPAFLAGIFKGKKTSVKAALLDQRLIAGIGNIYACEALFYAGIDPRRKAGKLTKPQWAKLAPAIKKVLRAAIRAGGSSLRDYRQASGELGTFQHHFAVYDREGQCCPGCVCDTAKTGGVRRMAQGGRSTFFCPRKQK
ncbi:MAG TPA: bifunctional DNA-formamidopyrimidine glycosylase/DNA-(apurinic or apyrimidinic site) lyase [Alphaproteobacteria bacterium]|nr:bifunctional DNA-formamidopyrimidine glycosylase/DNA-(apurinic or apyrimidinic site) lyase [Alphaproteobacteria bacterium]